MNRSEVLGYNNFRIAADEPFQCPKGFDAVRRT